MENSKSSPRLTITTGVVTGSKVARVSLTKDTAFARCVPSPRALHHHSDPLEFPHPMAQKSRCPRTSLPHFLHPRTTRSHAGRTDAAASHLTLAHLLGASSYRAPRPCALAPTCSDATLDSFEHFEVEHEDDDIDFHAPSKPKCVALGIGGGLIAALVIACIVGTVATTWCLTSGPCASVTATTSRSGAAAPSSVIAADMVAEFRADSAASSSGRRLIASSKVTLASGTMVDAQDIAAAGAKRSVDKTTYAAAIPAFVEGVVAHLKVGESYMLLSAQDRAEIFKVTARTMVREAVTKELAPARAYFAELKATHTAAASVVWGDEEKKVLAPLIKSANVPHYRADFAALVASKRRRLVATAPTTDEIKVMLVATNAAQVRRALVAALVAAPAPARALHPRPTCSSAHHGTPSRCLARLYSTHAQHFP